MEGEPQRQFDSIPVEEFERWLKPREAMTAFGYGIITGLQPFLDELIAGRIRAASEDVRWFFNGEQGQEAYALIPDVLWPFCNIDIHCSLWDHGQLSVQVPSSNYSGRDAVKMFDVRFEPRAKANLNETSAQDLIAANAYEREMEILGLKAKNAGRLPAAAPPVELKSLPLAEYGNLSRALVAGWGTTLTETQAWERAKAMFPEHKVGRDRFLVQYRKDRPEKKRGKQPLSG